MLFKQMYSLKSWMFHYFQMKIVDSLHLVNFKLIKKKKNMYLEFLKLLFATILLLYLLRF